MDAGVYLVLFELMLYVPVNSYGHVGTLSPFLWDFFPKLRRQCFKYNHPTESQRLQRIDG